jgi:uncharacterized protein
MELPALVQRTVARLIGAFSPERIIVFGSHAKGTAHSTSDFDLLVIVNVEGSLGPYRRRARQLAADCFPPVDIVLATPADVEDAETAPSPFLLSILGSGVTIYQSEQRGTRGP